MAAAEIGTYITAFTTAAETWILSDCQKKLHLKIASQHTALRSREESTAVHLFHAANRPAPRDSCFHSSNPLSNQGLARGPSRSQSQIRKPGMVV
ncbi:MAG: hypothetical protein ACK522_15155, partial [Synechococcaceae cyanobacterium]